MLKRSFFLFLSLCMMICASSVAQTSSLQLGIVATSDVTLRPLQLNQRDVVSVLNLVYEGLFTVDDNYLPQPCLASSYEFTNEGRRLIVTLRDDISFHSGKRLTAADVVATLDAMYELSGFDRDLNSTVPLSERGLYYSTFYSIRSWSSQDDNHILFNLRRTSYGSLYALTFPILPYNEIDSEMPSGTGPYRYDGYEQGSSIWLTVNPNWWKRTPQIRNIRASIYKDSEKVLAAFDQREVDVATTRSINASRYSGSLNSFSMIARSRQLEVLLVNRANGLFQSDDNGTNLVREAVYYAIDRSTLINSIYQGMATVAYSPIPSGTWLSDETIARDVYDPLMAASLLDRAGWKLADNGKRYKNGQSMPYLYLLVYDEPGSMVRTNAANKIREQLEAVGFSVTVNTRTLDFVTTKLRSGDFSIALCAFNFDIGPDPGFTITSTGSCNYTRYRSKEMNDLHSVLRTSWTQDGYRNAMLTIQKKFSDDIPYIPLYWRSSALLSRSAFTNVRDIRELELFRGVESFTD
ncbi:MAG: hypothetical protein K5746_09500 [Clostridiales bacterium]|nr:hypothetical protein [Clostridiales bacterium]